MASEGKRTIRSYRDLKVWKDAMAFVLELYRATEHFPAEERFNLLEQLRRAAVSIPANIAEGQGRSRKVFARHLDIALGSTAEVDTLLELALQLGYLPQEIYLQLHTKLMEIRKMLFGLHRSVLH